MSGKEFVAIFDQFIAAAKEARWRCPFSGTRRHMLRLQRSQESSIKSVYEWKTHIFKCEHCQFVHAQNSITIFRNNEDGSITKEKHYV